jgi:hypothetical protein
VDLSRIRVGSAARSGRLLGLAVAAGALALIGLAASDPSLPVDDAYISFSYARTAAAGAGLSLTPGAVPVEGFSNPLWVLVLALCARSGASLPQAAVLLAAAAAFLTTRQVGATTERLVGGGAWPVAAMALFVLAPGLGFHIASGLETMAATLALLVAFDAFVAQSSLAFNPRAALALLAFAWLRPEGVLVVIGWALLSWRDTGSRRSLLGLASALTASLLVRWMYFGQLLPNSILAKRGVDFATTMATGGAYLQDFAQLHAPVLVLAGAGLISLPRRAALAVAVPAAVLGTIAFGGAHAEGYPFQRYLFPLLPLEIVCGAGGASAIADAARRRGTLASGVFVVLMTSLVGLQLAIRTSNDVSWTDVPGRVRDAILRWRDGDNAPHDVSYPPYHRLSAWLAHRARPGDTIAMQEIGITAFYSTIGVLDTFGLADAHIARMPGRPGGKADAAYVFGGAPAVVAIRLAADGLRPGLLADDVYATDARMALEYDLAKFFPDSVTRMVATFTRREGLVAAESLIDRVPLPGRFAAEAPAFLGEAVSDPGLDADALAATARLHFKRWIEGVQWNVQSPDGSSSMPVDVPATGKAQFEVTLAPPPAYASASFVVSVTSSDGHRVDVSQSALTSGDPARARDVSIDLAPWRGQRVLVTLSYVGGPAAARAPGWLIWNLPRLVRLGATPTHRPTTPPLRPALDAVVVAQHVPDQMSAGRPYAVSVTMRNTGTHAWTAKAQHRLGSQSPVDGTQWAIGRVTLDDVEAVGPGEEHSFTFTVTAPRHAGVYGFQWRMLEEGREWFGALTPLVKVQVVAP